MKEFCFQFSDRCDSMENSYFFDPCLNSINSVRHAEFGGQYIVRVSVDNRNETAPFFLSEQQVN